VLRVIPSDSGVLKLLKAYVDAVFDDPALMEPEMRRVIIAQLCDLVVVTLGATRDAAAVAERRGIRAARLRAIKQTLIRTCASELSIDMIVGHQGSRIATSGN